MLVIENNYNDPFCENYLVNYGYVKINRIAINDFYIKQSIPINFKFYNSYYYCKNNWEPANVTNKIISLYSMFKFNPNYNTFIVSNDIFGDTILYSVKTLYINIYDSYNEITTLEFEEGSIVDWNIIEKMF